MATFVLVHPAWAGGWSWKKLVPLLRAAGHEVRTPTLTGLGERSHLLDRGVDLHTHVEDVVGVLTFEDLEHVVLVGSSSSGMVVTAVAERTPERLAELVYLDAFVPADGQSLFDLLEPDRQAVFRGLVETEGDGWLVPRTARQPWVEIAPALWQITDPADIAWMVPRLRATPFAHFTTPVRLLDPAARVLPRTYIRCLRKPHPAFDRFAGAAAASPGWRSRELDCGHLPYISCPEALAGLLLELVSEDVVSEDAVVRS
jgi:pimeloyl-ACP methyl ester carboxylesterase